MRTDAAFAQLEQTRLMAGMRGSFPPDVALKVANALMKGGIHILEFTLNSERAVEAMQTVKAQFGDKVVCGMGTVLSSRQAEEVIRKGADFIVSPSFNPAVVKAAQEADVLVGPGVATPTEIANAWSMGVKFVKLFPAGPLGIDYFKAIRGPLDQVRIMCNGGIDPESTRQFFRAGAFAIGAGSYLTGDGSMQLQLVAERARVLVNIVEETRRNTGQLRRT